MDPKLSEQLQQTLAALLANAQDAAAWTKGQIPLLVQEKIVFGRVWNTAMLVLCCAIAVVAFRTAKHFYCIADASRDSRYDIWPERPGGLLNVIASITCLVATAFAMGFSYDVALVWFAPRLYIVEWLMAQVHK